MAAPAVAAGSLQFGRVICRTFEIVRRNWLTLAGVSLLFAVAPGMVISRAPVWLALPRTVMGSLESAGFTIAAWLVPYSLLYAAGALVVAGDAEDRRVDLGATLGGSVAALPRVLVSYVLLTLGMLGGLVLLIVPGIIAVLAWEVALAAAVVERRWGWSALKRSAQLTRMRRGEIFGILFAVGIVFGLIGFCGAIAVKALGFSAAPHDWPIIVTEAALKFVSAPFGAVLSAVLYFELRRIHEGVTPGEAAVFD
jgi:hypothetical protein